MWTSHRYQEIMVRAIARNDPREAEMTERAWHYGEVPFRTTDVAPSYPRAWRYEELTTDD